MFLPLCIPLFYFIVKNFIVDSSINFFEELKKANESNNNNDDYDYDKKCLITNLPLTDNCITLECNHVFNYVPLYNDILNHKKKFNTMERKMLKQNEIRCPYCRNIQYKLLPYYDNIEGVKKVHGVNWFDEIESLLCNEPYSYKVGVCQYEDPENKCYKCQTPTVTTVDVLCKTLCYVHKGLLVQKYIKDKKQKQKDDEKLLKQKLKQEEKDKKKQEKEKLKQEKKMKIEEEKIKKQQEKETKQQESKYRTSDSMENRDH